MGKRTNRIPSAFKHGTFSGIGLLPTESPAKFRKFKKQMFSELAITGPLEEDIGDEIVRLEWRRKNLATYDLAQRARARHSSIHSQLVPRVRYLHEELVVEPHPDNPSPEELEVARKRANEKAHTDLGAALELVELGEVVTFEYLEKQLAIRDRLDAMIAQLYKKLAYVRGIKSMAPAALPAPSKLLLEKAA
jgi:hypothetical protein